MSELDGIPITTYTIISNGKCILSCGTNYMSYICNTQSWINCELFV